jgi:hypothetical protein
MYTIKKTKLSNARMILRIYKKLLALYIFAIYKSLICVDANAEPREKILGKNIDKLIIK